MIHTFTISYELSLADANTCTYRLNERTQAFKDKGFRLTKFLDVENSKFGRLIFKVPEFPGIKDIILLKVTDRNDRRIFRIYFQIEAEILRTGVDTLDLFFCSPEHAQELQSEYAKVIYSLFPESFTGRPASHLATSNFTDRSSYTYEEYINGENDNDGHGGMYSLPYLPLASVQRIDFAYDHVAANETQARLFTEMLSKSYYDGWKKKVFAGENKNKSSKAKSHDRAYASGSKTFSVYYKYDKMMSDEYNDRSNIAQIREDSRNVVRIEMPIKSPDRNTIKSLTWLQIPDDAITLGPLPYLATEQVPINLFKKEFFGRVGNDYDLKWYTRDELDKKINKMIRKNEISEHKGHTISKITAAISKRGSLNTYIKALKKYQATKDKQTKNDKKPFLTMKAFNDYKDLAMQNGMMLATIPAKHGVPELSAYLNLRNFDGPKITSQIISHMLPYHSITEPVPELAPAKDLYDSILKFLYGLYDQYVESHNAEYEKAKVSTDSIEE
jgi:hypothetical protein